jgi:hypothetical protein
MISERIAIKAEDLGQNCFQVEQHYAQVRGTTVSLRERLQVTRMPFYPTRLNFLGMIFKSKSNP